MGARNPYSRSDGRRSAVRRSGLQTRRGYGTSVICDLIPYELGGTVDINYVTDGVRCRIEFPLEKAAGHDRPTAFSGSRYPLPPDARLQAATSH